MKKIIIPIILFALVFISCVNTTEVTTTEDNYINTSIDAPTISLSNYTVSWEAITSVSEYEILVTDITTDDSDLLIENQTFTAESLSYDLSALADNHIYSIQIRSVIEEEHSEYSAAVEYNKFVYVETELDYSFNENSLDDFVAYLDPLNTIYFIEKADTKISSDYYYQEYGLLLLDNTYLQELGTSITFELYTDTGIINLNITKTDTVKPFMRSNNTIEFTGEDVLVVFELCGGELVEISGSDISTNDYELDGNILIIDSDFIQTLFDDAPDRTSVILSYQLRTDDEIVLGYIFINRISD